MTRGEFLETVEQDPQAALNTLVDEWPDVIKFSAYMIRDGYVNSSAAGEFPMVLTHLILSNFKSSPKLNLSFTFY